MVDLLRSKMMPTFSENFLLLKLLILLFSLHLLLTRDVAPSPFVCVYGCILFPQINGKQLNLGKYSTSAEAALRYDAHARKAFGDRARLNFPKPHSSELAHFEDANDAAAAAAALAACPPGAAADAAAEATAAAKLDPGYAISLGATVPTTTTSGSAAGASSDSRAGSSSHSSSSSGGSGSKSHSNNHKRARDGGHSNSSDHHAKSKRYGTSADHYLFNLDASNGASSSSNGGGASASRLAGGGGGDESEAVMSTRHASRRRPSESTEPRVRQHSRTSSEKLDDSAHGHGSHVGGAFSNGHLASSSSSSIGNSAAIEALNALSERRASIASSSSGGGGSGSGSHHSRPRKGGSGSGGAREANRALVREALALVRLLRHRNLSDAEVHDLDSLVRMRARFVLCFSCPRLFAVLFVAWSFCPTCDRLDIFFVLLNCNLFRLFFRFLSGRARRPISAGVDAQRAASAAEFPQARSTQRDGATGYPTAAAAAVAAAQAR